MRNQLAFLLVALIASPCLAQRQSSIPQGLPSVSDLIKNLDKNNDGKLNQQEVNGSRYARQFPRWDVNRDGFATETEIGNFRKKFGVPIEGTMKRTLGM